MLCYAARNKMNCITRSFVISNKKMARSHHRKKHKEHLRQFRNSQDTAGPKTGKGKTVGLFTAIGAAVGFAVSYFAAQGSAIWICAAIIAGAFIGYYIGHKIDTQKQ